MEPLSISLFLLSMLLITCADEYLGYCLTSHLAQNKHLREHMRVLCFKGDKVPACLANFRAKRIDVFPVDYAHPNDLSRAMRHVDQMILCVSHHPDRVQHAQQLCKIAAQSGVQSILYLSHVGALTETYSALGDYGQIEKYLIQLDTIKWTIMRLDWIQQYFHYWSCQVEADKQLKMPLKRGVGISPVHMADLCDIVSRMVIGKEGFRKQLEEHHVGQVYTITGPEKLTPEEIIKQMANATQFEGYKYQTIRPMDTQYYLKELSHNIWFDERLKRDERCIYHDTLEESLYAKVVFARLKGITRSICNF